MHTPERIFVTLSLERDHGVIGAGFGQLGIDCSADTRNSWIFQ